MITVDIKKDNPKGFKKIVKLSKRDAYFKACGNLDYPWIILKFKTKEEFLIWLGSIEAEKIPHDTI